MEVVEASMEVVEGSRSFNGSAGSPLWKKWKLPQASMEVVKS